MRAKIQAGLPQPEDRVLAEAPYFNLNQRARNAPDYGPLRRAIRDRRIVEIIYRTGGGGAAKKRRIYPVLICDLPDGWMVSAWYELRENFRTFRGDRIDALRVTDERFAEDATRDLRAFMATENRELKH